MKVKVYTLGCKVNTYESEYAIKEFLKRGYEIADLSDENIDICLINTCTVTNVADQKSRKIIRKLRRENKNAVIAVMGCYTQIRENNDSIINDVDIIIGNNKKSKIVDLVEEFIKTKKKIVDVSDINKEAFDDMKINTFNTRTRALIKIEDGCENFCSYCIIPYTRGKVRSKNPKKVIEEAECLAKNGYKEIVLTGIHTGHYGSDLDNYDFSDLLNSLENIDGIERIRISSIEIVELNDKFLDVLKNSKKIVNHIHIPLQAGSNHILKLMNRRYDKKFYKETVDKIRKVRPDMAITTDVIVGFPGETKEDFKETISFVREINFAGGHVFPFSSRNNTPASKMSGHLTKEEKHERVRLLISVFEEEEENFYKSMKKKTLKVIPEVFYDGYLTGHADNYLKVKFKGCENLIGKIIDVKIVDIKNKMCEGIIVNNN